MAATREKWQRISPPKGHTDKIYFLNTNPQCEIRFLVLQFGERKPIEVEDDLYKLRIYAVFSGAITHASTLLGIPDQLATELVENPVDADDVEFNAKVDLIHYVFGLKNFSNQEYYFYIKGNLDDENDADKFLTVLDYTAEEVDTKTINMIKDIIRNYLVDEFSRDINELIEQGRDDLAWDKAVQLESKGYYELTWDMTEAQLPHLDRNALIERYTHISQNNPMYADEALERLINIYGEEKGTTAEERSVILEKQFKLAMMMKIKNSVLISRLFNEMAGKPFSVNVVDITTVDGLIVIAREMRNQVPEATSSKKKKSDASVTTGGGIFAASAAASSAEGVEQKEEPAENKTEPAADNIKYSKKRPHDDSIDEETKDPEAKRRKNK